MVRVGDPFCRNFSQKDISRGDRRAVLSSNSGRRSETRTDYYLPFIDPQTTQPLYHIQAPKNSLVDPILTSPYLAANRINGDFLSQRARTMATHEPQCQLFPFYFPDCRFSILSDGRTCTSIMNSSGIQIAHRVKQPFIVKIKRMVIRQWDSINMCNTERRDHRTIGYAHTFVTIKASSRQRPGAVTRNRWEVCSLF